MIRSPFGGDCVEVELGENISAPLLNVTPCSLTKEFPALYVGVSKLITVIVSAYDGVAPINDRKKRIERVRTMMGIKKVIFLKIVTYWLYSLSIYTIRQLRVQLSLRGSPEVGVYNSTRVAIILSR